MMILKNLSLYLKGRPALTLSLRSRELQSSDRRPDFLITSLFHLSDPFVSSGLEVARGIRDMEVC